MPLYNINTPHYLNRRRIFIDTDLRDPEMSINQYDSVYRLDDLYQKVQSIELVAFNVPRAIFPTFVERQTHEDGTDNTGNNLIDIRLRDVPLTQELVFTVTIPPSYFKTATELSTVLGPLIESTMDAQGDAFFNTGAGVAISLFVDTTTSPNEKIIYNSAIGGNSTIISMEFLFETGTNVADSAWKVLGFIKNQDAGGYDVDTGGFITNDPLPSRAVLLQPYRYIDISIEEFPELSPIARIFVTDESITSDTAFLSGQPPANASSYNRLKGPRLLSSNPLRHIDTFHLRIRFEGNVRPLPEFDHLGMDFTFDMLILSPEQAIPCWVEQRLAF